MLPASERYLCLVTHGADGHSTATITILLFSKPFVGCTTRQGLVMLIIAFPKQARNLDPSPGTTPLPQFSSALPSMLLNRDTRSLLSGDESKIILSLTEIHPEGVVLSCLSIHQLA